MYAAPGKDSWAVVTGGSDGIGLEMANRLAGQGFNICIVARNEKKMEKCLSDIKAKYSEVKTLAVVADFAKMMTVQDYVDKVADKVKDLDIGVLIVNAGLMCFNYVADQSEQEVQDQFNINGAQVVYVIKALLA